MRKSIKALLATGLILLPLTACNITDTYEDRENKESYSVIYALKENKEYTLTQYDRLEISTDTFFNTNGKIFKFSMRTLYNKSGRDGGGSIEYFYIVENIGKKVYGDSYIWYYAPDVSWNIEVYYSTK